MTTIVILAIVIFLVLCIAAFGKKASKNQSQTPTMDNPNEKPEEPPEALPIQGAYQKNWLFSYNEKDAYQKLRAIADELGYTVFAKVRLLDLLSPVKGNPKYKTYFYKVQSKHVDFVLCDAKLVARAVVELDDSSHESKKRQERDSFVDEVLTSVGYPIFHVKAVTDDLKNQISELAAK